MYDISLIGEEKQTIISNILDCNCTMKRGIQELCDFKSLNTKLSTSEIRHKFKSYEDLVASNGIMFIPSFMTIGLAQKLKRGTHTDSMVIT